MPRSISWQGRLRDIHRQVSESPRDPYHRADLEKLFRLKRRATLELMELMPRQSVGSSTVIERADLLEFAGQALDAEDLGAMLEQLRQSPPKPKRRKLRVYVPRDFEPGNLRSMDKRIFLRRGRIELHFEMLEELVAQLHQLATVIEVPEFERRFCRPPAPSPESAETQHEVDELFAELERMEAEHGITRPAAASAEPPA